MQDASSAWVHNLDPFLIHFSAYGVAMTQPVEAAPRSEVKILTGNQAAAWGAWLARVEVASAYPITPQTTVIETL
ncbi:MAG: hypothetical protein AAB250_14110, partial [Bdellovibrionota bacterium]